MRRAGTFAVIFGLSLLFFQLWIGISALNPYNRSWLTAGDPLMHLIGSMFFMGSRWSFPPAAIPGLMYPFGTSVGITDSIPLLAFPAKLLAPILTPRFQYFGIWLFLCVFLQISVAFALLSKATRSSWLFRIIGAVILGISPPFLFRAGHEAFCMQALILAIFLIDLQARENSSWTWLFLLTAISAAIQPYLLLFTSSYAALHAWFFRRSWTQLTRRIVTLAAASLAVLWLSGFLSSSSLEGFGADIGFYSADLTTLFNSLGTSRWIPAIRAGLGQYEGYAYLGIGGSSLLVLTLYRKSSGRLGKIPGSKALQIWVLAFAFLSLCPVIRFGLNPILSLRFIFHRLEPLPSMFRSNGRFIWPLWYAIVFLGLRELSRAFGRTVSVALVMILAVAQFSDLTMLGLRPPSPEAPENPYLVSDLRSWSRPDVHLQMLPPFQECTHEHLWSDPDRFWISEYAATSGLTLSSAVTARMQKDLQPLCESTRRNLESRRFLPDTVYFSALADQESEELQASPNLVCRTIEHFVFCKLRPVS